MTRELKTAYANVDIARQTPSAFGDISGVTSRVRAILDIVNDFIRQLSEQVSKLMGINIKAPGISIGETADSWNKRFEAYVKKVTDLSDQQTKGFKFGGLLSDSRNKRPEIPALLEQGEYVLNKETTASLVRRYGRATLERINKSGTIPNNVQRFHTGGMVGEGSAIIDSKDRVAQDNTGPARDVNITIKSHAPQEVESLVRNVVVPAIDRISRKRAQ